MKDRPGSDIDFEPGFFEDAEILAAHRGRRVDPNIVKEGFGRIRDEFPLLANSTMTVSIHRAMGRKEEGITVHAIGEGLKQVTLRMQPMRLFDHALLQTFVAHYFMKASDMVDPCFGHPITTGAAVPDPDGQLEGRLQELWDSSIAERLGYQACSYTADKASLVFFSLDRAESGTYRDARVTYQDLVSRARYQADLRVWQAFDDRGASR
ncbi:MAG: hypothetical protein MOGMAGMI_02132 [Candidatus Omnitrophica bacterium]|nr:hypothetical protein [Candidatus Omnitrophota bacterium]